MIPPAAKIETCEAESSLAAIHERLGIAESTYCAITDLARAVEMLLETIEIPPKPSGALSRVNDHLIEKSVSLTEELGELWQMWALILPAKITLRRRYAAAANDLRSRCLVQWV